tara:strand:- start:108 stop:473 length:366 start_codon:yes stop_codon:yes gene_type:complete
MIEKLEQQFNKADKHYDFIMQDPERLYNSNNLKKVHTKVWDLNEAISKALIEEDKKIDAKLEADPTLSYTHSDIKIALLHLAKACEGLLTVVSDDLHQAEMSEDLHSCDHCPDCGYYGFDN